MTREIFVDTSGFFALLVKQDEKHRRSDRILKGAAGSRRGFVTTDYVLDETSTLLKARGHGHVLAEFFERVFASGACRVEWTDAERFATAQSDFLKRLDQPWSFTDCLSFRVMNELRLTEALTKDAHFQRAGFRALLM